MIISLLLFIVVIVIAFFAAKEFENIAVEKGFRDSKYFWWCFLCGVIGYLMVIALPNKAVNASTDSDKLFSGSDKINASNNKENISFSSNDNNRIMKQEGSWMCSCGKANYPYVLTCSSCGKLKSGSANKN